MTGLRLFGRGLFLWPLPCPGCRPLSFARSPKAQQAVGRALAANPFFVLIPCHRVVSAAAKAAFDVLNPQTFQTPAFLGRPEFAGIGAWLRLHDLAQAA